MDVTELPRPLGYAERPRVGQWSLRSALVRYAQPEPARAGAVLELVRRTDAALEPWRERIEQVPELVALAADGASDHQRTGPAPGNGDGDDVGDTDGRIVGLLRAAHELDRLGDVLAAWAAGRDEARPDREVQDTAGAVFALLDHLGVARETRRRNR